MSMQQTKDDEELTEKEWDRRVQDAEEERNEIDGKNAQAEFDFTYPDAKGFRDLLQIINIVKDEPTFTINAKELQFIDMDPSHIAMIKLNCNSKAFSAWSVPKAGRFSVNIGYKGGLMADLSKARKDKNSETNLAWNILSEGTDLNVRIEKPDHTLKCKYGLLSADLANKPMPLLTYTVKISVIGKTLNKILTDSFTNSNQIKFVADYERQSLTFLYKDEYGEKSVTLDKNSPAVLEIDVQKDVTSYIDKQEKEEAKKYKVKETAQPSMLSGTLFLSDFVSRLTAVMDTATLEYSQDKPVHVYGKSNDGNVEVEFWLAPRIEE